MVSESDLLAAYCESIEGQLSSGLEIIEHCIEQLDHDQIWHRPTAEMNSIANLLIHLEGNVRQWLINGISERPDLRDRQSEFDDRSGRAASDLMEDLKKTVAEACRCVREQTAEDLVRRRLVQEWEETGFSAIANSTTHFVGHVQEIVHMTRAMLGKQYRYRFVPKDQTED